MGSTGKLAGVAGIVWVIANVGLGMAAGSPPGLDEDGSTIRAYLLDNRTLALVGAAVFAVTVPLLLVFFGELIGRMRATEDRPSVTMAGAATAGLAVFVVGLGMAYLATLPLVFERSIGANADDGLVSYLYALGFLTTMLGNIGFGSVLVAIGLSPAAASARVRASAVVIGGLAIVGSSLGMLNKDVAMIAGLGFLLLGVWMLVVAIPMVRSDRQREVAVAARSGI